MKVIIIGDNFSQELKDLFKDQLGKNLTVTIEFEHNNGKYRDTGITKNNMPVLEFVPAEKRYTKCMIKLIAPSGAELHYSAFAIIKGKDNFNRNIGRDLSFTRVMNRFVFNKVLTKSQRALVWNTYWSRSPKTVARSSSRISNMKLVHSKAQAA